MIASAQLFLAQFQGRQIAILLAVLVVLLCLFDFCLQTGIYFALHLIDEVGRLMHVMHA